MIEVFEERIIDELLPNGVFEEIDGSVPSMDMEIIEQIYAQMMGWA